MEIFAQLAGEVVPLLDLHDDDGTDNNVSNDGDGTTGDDLDDNDNGDHYGNGTAYGDINGNCNGAMDGEVNNDGNGAKLSLPSMRRRLCRHRDSVAALVVMTSLPSPIPRHLAVVDDDGDGVTGNDNYDDFNNAMDFAVIAMALLPSSQWRYCRCQCAGVLPLSTMMATAQWATKSMMMAKVRRVTTSTMMVKERRTMSSTTIAMARRMTKLTTIVMARWAMKLVTMAMAKRDTTTMTMSTYIDVNNDTSLMTSNGGTISVGDNSNRDDSEDTCASTATTSAHRRRATTQPVMRWRCAKRQRRRIARQKRLEDERRRRRNKWGIASCDNQMVKKRSRQSREAESAASRQLRR